jgi:hypothetical protein
MSPLPLVIVAVVVGFLVGGAIGYLTAPDSEAVLEVEGVVSLSVSAEEDDNAKLERAALWGAGGAAVGLIAGLLVAAGGGRRRGR